MKKRLKPREHLVVVRLELNTQISEEFQKDLSSLIRVEPHQIFVDHAPLNMRYVFQLIGELPKEISMRFLYPSHRPRWAEDLRQDRPMITQIQERDRLLFYPYDSVGPFLRLLNEAANNMAENGKEVLVLMELRARFDEENNLAWSKMLEDSGCR